jgi:hypothetical protein
MRRELVPILLMAGAGLVAGPGCDDGQANVLGGVQSIVYIQRTVDGTGNVFDYRSGGTDANLFVLSPPTASGTRKNLTNWKGAQIVALDLSFDAREIAFSAKAPGDDNFHIWRINVDGTNPCDAAMGKVSMGACQVTDGPSDDAYPVYQPGGRLMFMTTANVEGTEVPQHRDEYERQTTAQPAMINVDGSNLVLGPRNVSHRVFPSLLSDGRTIYTEWNHLGPRNDGDLQIMNQDLTGQREAFGGEGKGITNNYLRAKEVSPGKVVAIGTARDRTYQAGKLVLIDLGGPTVNEQSEAKSKVIDLTPDVPGDRSPSFRGIGRYYDVAPVPGKADKYLVSWADGPVEQEVLTMAGASPDFGIYVYDAKTKERFPIVNEVGTWETNATPVIPRAEPPRLETSFSPELKQATLFAAINITDSSLFPGIDKSQVKKVRVAEGFSAEEGFPNMFGLTEFDGMARLGDVDLNPDGSFKVLVPANTAIRFQLLDKYGMALGAGGNGTQNTSEPVWIMGRAGEARVCGGCHEDRTKAIQLSPGASLLQAVGAARLDYEGVPIQQRKSEDYSIAKIMGVPWDKALQPIFDAKCVDCHDGTDNGANPGYAIQDTLTMATFNFRFNLKSDVQTVTFGDMTYSYPSSHISLLGPSEMLREVAFTVTQGTIKAYVEPGFARGSEVIKMLNPPAIYPTVNLNDRAFGANVHPKGLVTGSHDGNDPKYELTPDEYYRLILMADSGGQFYTRENKPGGMGY